MAEKNILAYFHTREQAKAVELKLQALRATATQIEGVDAYPSEAINNPLYPITGDIPSLGALTLGAEFSNKSAAILSAASVSASGMSDGGQHAVTGQNILLVAVMPEETHKQALQVIKDAGGLV